MRHSTRHKVLAIVWALQGVGAVVCLAWALTHDIDPTKFFLLSVGYISLCSIYANFVGHWGAYEAAVAQEKVSKP